MKKPELLSPVGNMECLVAAIEAGCDAVYLGGKNFGAREFAQNFNNDEIVKAIKYAHLYGVKVYVTVNTLIYDEEVNEFLNYIEFLHKNNVDAIITADLGMVDLIRKTYPNLEIHASTQMHIHNAEGVKLAKKLGIKRVVLARETKVDLIKKIKEEIDMPLEIFVHGALCISYSGQCLMSSLIGGRSGNRGTCAQCCRLKYDLISNDKKINEFNYLLSTKDLCTINHIGKLIDIGVDSFKIEGRMKRPEYVYLVTSIYRKAIDNYIEKGNVSISDDDIYKLKKIFNRDFTKGFLFKEDNNNFTNEKRPNHIGVEVGKVLKYKNSEVTIKLFQELSKNDGIRIITKNNDVGGTIIKMFKDNIEVEEALKNDIVTFKFKGDIKPGDVVVKTTDYKDLIEIQNKIKNKERKVKINAYLKCKKGKPIVYKVSDGKNEVEVISEYIVEGALNTPTTKERIISQIKKLGDSIYEYDNLLVDTDDKIFVKISELNEIRRRGLNLLNNKRLYQYDFVKEKYSIDVPSFNRENKINYLINSLDDYNSIKTKDINEIFVEDETLYSKIKDKRTVLKLMRVISEYKDYKTPLLVSEIGGVNKYKNVYTDFSLNVTNSYTVALLHSLNVKRITLSYELNDYQIKNLIYNYQKRYGKNPNLELIVSSYPEVMVSKYNLIKKYNLKGDIFLKQKGKKFRLEEKNGLMYIYHFEKIELKDYDKYFEMGINYLRVNL